MVSFKPCQSAQTRELASMHIYIYRPDGLLEKKPKIIKLSYKLFDSLKKSYKGTTCHVYEYGTHTPKKEKNSRKENKKRMAPAMALPKSNTKPAYPRLQGASPPAHSSLGGSPEKCKKKLNHNQNILYQIPRSLSRYQAGM